MDDQNSKMSSLERGALVAEIVGAVAVVISIIYLGYQVGENTSAVRVQTAHALLELQMQRAAWDKDIAHVELVMRGDTDPSSLSPAEWEKYGTDRSGDFNLWEQVHYSYLHGDIDPEQWKSWDRSYVSMLCSPGVLMHWQKSQQGWNDKFQAHVNERIAAC